jgi:CheY-like chemotaxis protein
MDPVRRKQILMVDDSAADAGLLATALAECDDAPQFQSVTSAVRALSYLAGQPPYASEPRPDLIIMDLNMAVNSGHEAVRAIRNEPAWDNIPLYVFTSSILQSDVDDSFKSGADGHIRKPLMYTEYLKLAQSICDHLALGSAIKESIPRTRRTAPSSDETACNATV